MRRAHQILTSPPRSPRVSGLALRTVRVVNAIHERVASQIGVGTTPREGEGVVTDVLRAVATSPVRIDDVRCRPAPRYDDGRVVFGRGLRIRDHISGRQGRSRGETRVGCRVGANGGVGRSGLPGVAAATVVVNATTIERQVLESLALATFVVIGRLGRTLLVNV